MQNMPEVTPVREKHRIDEAALIAYLNENVEGDFSDLKVLQFEGGQSNPTYQLHSGGKKYVMRKKPPGQLLKSAHAVDREYRVITALADTDVPVPKTYCLCEDDSIIGTTFFVMENVEGRVFSDPSLPGVSKEERAAIYDHFIEVIAALHKVDYLAVGLETFGRPGNYYTRQISRWSKQYVASETEKIEAMDQLMEWLPEHIPPGEEPTIVHGDYRIGNTIVHPTEPRISAVLDWELSTIGHPFGDLGYCCMGYHHAGALGADEFAAGDTGIPSEAQILARYCELTGRPEIENWLFYIIYNLFRISAITQGVYKRGLDGNASSEHWGDRGNRTQFTAQCGWDLVAKLKG